MLRIHCNQCDTTKPGERDGYPQSWIGVYADDDGGTVRIRAAVRNDAAQILAGHYCSVGCLMLAVQGFQP